MQTGGEEHWTRRGVLFAAGAALGAGALIGFQRASAAEGSETVIQTAAIRLAPGKAAEALDVIGRVCTAVERNEPGVLVYLAQRSADDPQRVLFFEIYRNAQAAEAHNKTPHVAEFAKAFGTLLLPDGGLQRYARIAGFARGA
jgi:quinol monooxygenase YgiN